MRSAYLLCIVVAALLVLVISQDAWGRSSQEPEPVRQARPIPPRPKTFDELLGEYNRLKAANARNTDLGRVIRNASSFKEPRVAAWLKSLFNNEKDSYVRQTAVSTLGNLHTREAANALLEMYQKLKNGSDTNMKNNVTRALVSVAEFLPFQLLVDLLKRATTPQNRASIARAIGKLGTKEAITLLLNTIPLDEKDPSIARYGERYRIATVVKEVARDCTNQETVSWLIGEILPNPKIPEAARVALLKGFTDRNRSSAEREQKSLKQEEERKKAQEAARKDPNAPPLPPLPPRRATPAREPAKPVPVEKFAALLDDRSQAVRAAAAILMAESADGSAIPVLIEHLSEKKTEVLIQIVYALGELRAAQAVQPLLDMLPKMKWEVKAAIIDALGKIGDPLVVETLKKYLSDNRWQVRASTIEALSRIRSKESVTALIERMKKESGRLLGDIARALEKLTALELGADAKAWDNWWKVARDRYVLPEEVSSSPETANPGMAQGPKTELAKTPKYHGIPVLSHRICFIIDISGSMSSQMRRSGQQPGGAKPGQPGGLGSPGTADPSKKKEEKKKEPIFKGPRKRVQPKDNSKMEFAKAELINCLLVLNPKVRFNIISFETSIQAWKKKLVPASRENRREAIRWTTAMRPTGATNLGDAILLAFEDKDVDTIFVLSDGQPNQGRLPSADMILNEVRRLNSARRIVIHTINFAGAKEFMRQLAEENGGEFVDY